jgi:hypothetical protein
MYFTSSTSHHAFMLRNNMYVKDVHLSQCPKRSGTFGPDISTVDTAKTGVRSNPQFDVVDKFTSSLALLLFTRGFRFDYTA